MVFGQKSFNITHSITDEYECSEPPCNGDDENIGVSTSTSGFTNTLSVNDIHQGEFTIDPTNNTSYGLVLYDDGSRYFYESSQEENGSHVSEDDSESIDFLNDTSYDLALPDGLFSDDTYDLEDGLQIGELVDDSNAMAGSPIDISNFGMVDMYDSCLATYDQVKLIKVTNATTETVIDLTGVGIEIENVTNE